MKRLAVSALATALIAASGSAFAYDQDNGYDNGYDRYNDNSDSSADYTDGYRNDGPTYDTAQVIRVDPIIDRYRVESHQHCWIEQSRYHDHHYYGHDDGTGGAVLGALVGGALGNQVGKGDGRTAATIAGAVIGGSIGYNVDRNNGHYDGYNGYRNGTVRRCESTGYGRDRYDDRVVAYNVTYRYGSRTYQTVTNYHPGNSLRVTVDVRPTDPGVAYR
jgi:uncharacterized protein YcfJ